MGNASGGRGIGKGLGQHKRVDSAFADKIAVETTPPKPLRLLIVLPSWVGDVVMATPVLRRIRRALPGAFIGALARPGIDQLLAGCNFIDEFHVQRASGVMGPKFVAAKVRPRRYDTALLLTNSLSTALIARIAGIPRRIGYDRDGRGMLLTDRLQPPIRSGWKDAVSLFSRTKYEIVPACTYYWRAADVMLGESSDIREPFTHPLPAQDRGQAVCMELATTDEEEREADRILANMPASDPAVKPSMRTRPLALLNPGGNNQAKRWPAECFAKIADWLATSSAKSVSTGAAPPSHSMSLQNSAFDILFNGSPNERELCEALASRCQVAKPLVLPEHGITLGALKAITRRCQLMVTNDTGPRHIAAAFGVPLVSLFGPTDHRWTVIPTKPGAREAVVVADPTLPADETANDHPERCSIEHISVDRVQHAVREVLEQTHGSQK